MDKLTKDVEILKSSDQGPSVRQLIYSASDENKNITNAVDLEEGGFTEGPVRINIVFMDFYIINLKILII